MTRTLINTFRAFAAIVLLAAGLVQAEEVDKNLEAVRIKISELFSQVEPEHIDYGPMDGWYKIQVGSVIAYVSDDGRYLMQGDLIDLDADVNLTELSRNDSRRELMANIGDDQVILFSPPDPLYTVTIFTDVECTYCRRLHSEIDQYMSAGIAVRYVLYPRNGPASRAWNTSEEVWCASDRNGALTAAKLDREFQSVACDASIIQDNYILGRDVGLEGTPAIVLENGEMIGGYIPPAILSQRLQEISAN